MAKTTKNPGGAKPAQFKKQSAPQHPGVHPPKSGGGKATPSKAAKMAQTGTC